MRNARDRVADVKRARARAPSNNVNDALNNNGWRARTHTHTVDVAHPATCTKTAAHTKQNKMLCCNFRFGGVVRCRFTAGHLHDDGMPVPRPHTKCNKCKSIFFVCVCVCACMSVRACMECAIHNDSCASNNFFIVFYSASARLELLLVLQPPTPNKWNAYYFGHTVCARIHILIVHY